MCTPEKPFRLISNVEVSMLCTTENALGWPRLEFLLCRVEFAVINLLAMG